MRATILNCTLKPSPARSQTETLAGVVGSALQGHGVSVDSIRVADHHVPPGVETDMGDGDGWPRIHDALTSSEILVVASPTWVGRPSSIAQRVIERMNAMLSETDDDERPIAFDRVVGVVVTGNEDGAHHVISEIGGALGDIGYTIPAQAFTYWNMGPGPGPEYTDTEHGHEWAHATARAMASNLVAVARALQQNPMPAPPS